MVIRVRDTETRKIIGTFSNYISLIWTERFQTYGDFELVVPLTRELFDLLKMDRYLEIATSSNLMIIEEVQIQDEETSQTMTVTGLSFESVLARRVIFEWRNTQNEEYLTYIIGNLITKAFITPPNDYAYRRVPWIDLAELLNNLNAELGSLKIRTSINRGDNLGDSLFLLGRLSGFGLRTVFHPDTLTVSMQAYVGSERNIIFKKANFNFKSSSYLSSISEFKTSAFVAGEGEDSARKTIVVSRSTTEKRITEDGQTEETIIFNYNGITRREIFVDARDIQKQSGETNTDYLSRLKERGKEKLSENNKTYAIDGTITNTGRYILNQDYNLGDLVRVETNFYSATVRITEVIQSWSNEGYNIYPTFEVVEVDSAEISETFE